MMHTHEVNMPCGHPESSLSYTCRDCNNMKIGNNDFQANAEIERLRTERAAVNLSATTLGQLLMQRADELKCANEEVANWKHAYAVKSEDAGRWLQERDTAQKRFESADLRAVTLGMQRDELLDEIKRLKDRQEQERESGPEIYKLLMAANPQAPTDYHRFTVHPWTPVCEEGQVKCVPIEQKSELGKIPSIPRVSADGMITIGGETPTWGITELREELAIAVAKLADMKAQLEAKRKPVPRRMQPNNHYYGQPQHEVEHDETPVCHAGRYPCIPVESKSALKAERKSEPSIISRQDYSDDETYSLLADILDDVSSELAKVKAELAQTKEAWHYELQHSQELMKQRNAALEENKHLVINLEAERQWRKARKGEK